MLKQLLSRKPRWQHAKAEVRKQAINELKHEDTEVLLTIATQDDEPQLRCMAVRKISDLDLLKKLSLDAHWEVKQLAEQRYQQLLAGQKGNTLNLHSRLERIQVLEDDSTLAFLLKEGKEAELRLAVLEKIHHDSLCGDVAEADSAANVRLCAAEKITQRSTLERVMKHSRNKDKKVYRVVKEKLDTLLEAEERPKRLRAARAEVCKRLELLRKLNDWSAGAQELQRVQQEWQALEEESKPWGLSVEAEDQTQIEHFQQLQTTCTESLQKYREEQQAYAEQRAEKQAVLDQLQTFLDELKALEHIEHDASQAFDVQLDELRTRWDYSGTLPEHEEQKMQSRFKQAHKQVSSQLAALRHCQTIGMALEKLCQQAEKLLTQKKAVLPKMVTKLQNTRQTIEHPQQPNLWLQTFSTQFETLNTKLEARLEEQQQQRKHRQQMLKQRLDELETALDNGEFQKATDLEQKARALLELLGDMPKAKRSDWEQRLQRSHLKIQDLRGWQRWGNRLGRDALCEKMEALIGIEADPEDLAQRVKDAQNEWKNLKDGQQDKKLWGRFNAACQKVYEPCQRHFELKSQERQQHYTQKLAICEKLSEYEATADWKSREFDWKATYQWIKQQRKDWYQVGPTDRKQRKELQERFDSIEATLEEHLSRERKRNLHQREALIEKINALSAVEKTHEAIEKVKELKKEWVISVPGERKVENAIWKTFQAACDAVFERRKQERSSFEKSLESHQKEKESLCQHLEQLRNDLDAPMNELPAEWKKAEQAWDGIGEAPKKLARKLDKRFADAVRDLEKHYARWQQDQHQEQLELLKTKAALCTCLERAEAGHTDELTRVQADWEALESLHNNGLEKKIEQRFQTAVAHIQGEQVFDASTNVSDQRRLLCIRLELLSGQESPASDRELRMSYQVERLSRAMSGDNVESPLEAQNIIEAFYLLSPAQEDDGLEIRFAKTQEALHANES